MRTFQVDFSGIREGVAIDRIIPILDLQVKKEQGKNEYRGRCPACNTNNDRALQITPDTRSFRCYAANQSGDVTGLVAHIKGIRMLEAGRFLHAHFHPTDTPKAEVIPLRPQEPPQAASEAAQESQKATGDNVLMPLTSLTHEHPDVQALGFSVEEARAIGLGYCRKGLMRSKVAIPLRSETGKLLGYIGLTGCDLKRPKEFRF